MSPTATAPLPLHDAGLLAAHLREHNLPGQRSKTAITGLRRERANRDAERSVALFIPASGLVERAEARLLGKIRAEVERRGGETEIHGRFGAAPLLIKDRDLEARITLVRAEGYRDYGKRHGCHWAAVAYLYGEDDDGSGPWAVRVPRSIDKVAFALAWLEPAYVSAARAAGRRVWRQGDLYAVETSKQHDGAGAEDLPDSHRWNPQTRYLTHHPDDGRKHRPLRLTRPVRFVRQTTYDMARTGRRGNGD